MTPLGYLWEPPGSSPSCSCPPSYLLCQFIIHFIPEVAPVTSHSTLVRSVTWLHLTAHTWWLGEVGTGPPCPTWQD